MAVVGLIDCAMSHIDHDPHQDPSKEATGGIRMSSPDSGFGFLRMHPSCHDHPPDVSLPDDVKPFSNISGGFKKGRKFDLRFNI